MTLRIRYEFDPTGENPNNFIAEETHTITTNRKVRILVPMTKPYYTDSMVLIDNKAKRTLVRGVDWEPIDTHRFLQEATGKDVAGACAIVNQAVSNSLTISYQNVGAHQTFNNSNLREQLDYLLNDKRPVPFAQIIGKPDGYNPNPHRHALGDIYGFEYFTNMLDEIRRAIELGLYPYLSDIMDYIDERLKNVRIHGDLQGIIDEFRRHIQDKNNPHETKLDAADILNRITELENSLRQHIENKNNPHETRVTGGVTEQWVMEQIRKIQFPTFDPTAILTRLSAVEAKFANYYTATQVDNKLKNYYNREEIDRKFADLPVLLNPVTKKIYNTYIPVSKAPNNTVQLMEDGLYVGDQTDKKYATNYVNAVTGVDDDSDPKSGSQEKPYKTIGFALSVGAPLAKREIHVYEGQIHYVSLPNGGSFGEKSALELRGGVVDILPYGPRTAGISDPPQQTKYKRLAVRNLNTRLVFRGVEVWGSGNNLLRMDSLSITRNGTLRFWGLNIKNEIPSMCYNFSPTQYAMSQYISRLNFNSVGTLEFHNCAIDTGGQEVDKEIPSMSARRVKDYSMIMTTSATPPQLSVVFEGSIADDGVTWDRDLKITGFNHCFDFYSKQTSRLVVDQPANPQVLRMLNQYTRKPRIRTGGYAETLVVHLGQYTVVDTNINPSDAEIAASLQKYLS